MLYKDFPNPAFSIFSINKRNIHALIIHNKPHRALRTGGVLISIVYNKDENCPIHLGEAYIKCNSYQDSSRRKSPVGFSPIPRWA